MEELVRGTRSDGSGESRTEAISLGLFKGQAREIGTRKQQQGERERERDEGKEKGEARELLAFGSGWSRRGRKVVRSGDEEEGRRWWSQVELLVRGSGDRPERWGTGMVLGLAGAGGGDRGWAAAESVGRDCRDRFVEAGAAGLGVARGGEGAGRGEYEARERGKEWAAAELAADHIVLPQDGVLQRRLRRVDRSLGRCVRRRLHRPPGRGREGPGRLLRPQHSPRPEFFLYCYTYAVDR
jgi:hypothetical protein